MNERLPSRRVVLWGVGHTNAHVLRLWGMHPFPDTELVCVSNFSKATYSGMLPGVLAGQYPESAIEIDLVRLCQQNKTQLIVEEVTGINLTERTLQFRERPPLPFDALSIGIGSVPTTGGVLFAPQARVLQLKPMQTLPARLQQSLSEVATSRPASPLRIAIVGGGAAGVEVALCLRRHVRKTFETFAEVCLVHAGGEVLPGVTTGLRQRVQRELERSGIPVHTGHRVVSVEVDCLHCDDGSTIEADVVLWAAAATGPPILSQLGLPTDERGFLQTDSTLTVCGHPGMFAVGDTGTIQNTTMAKSGVYAVREGPVLWDNLFFHLTGASMRRYEPQQSFMKLLNFGNGRAAGEWRGFSFEGKWAWWLKNSIDTAFMKKFQVADAPQMSSDDNEMNCLGCGGKVGPAALSRLLQEHQVEPEDGALVSVGDSQLVMTTDFFASPVRDPYLAGRLAAVHALGDMWAMAARPTSVVTNMVVPFGEMKAQEQCLKQMVAGAEREFSQVGAKLVGGQTIEGPRMELGFTLLGEPPKNDDELFLKRNGQAGDFLVLTKPLGTGVLLAGAMRAQCRAEWWDDLLESLLQHQTKVVELALQHGVRCATDITGFGLAGHLAEVMKASNVSARIRLGDLPLLPGASELVIAGLRSSLDGANHQLPVEIQSIKEVAEHPWFALLFDPQTCGGLMLAVAPDRKDAFCQSIQDSGGLATVVGTLSKSEASPILKVNF